MTEQRSDTSSSPGSPDSIVGILDALKEELPESHGGESRDSADIGVILEAVGSRAAGPLLFLPALLMISPIGALPGVPIILATLIILISAQILIGSSKIWLPGFLRKRKLPAGKLRSAIDWMRPYARRVDSVLGQHLEVLARPPMPRFVAFLCILLAIVVYPATLIPAAAAFPGGAIVVLSLGLLARDGIVTLIGLAISAGAFATVFFLT